MQSEKESCVNKNSRTNKDVSRQERRDREKEGREDKEDVKGISKLADAKMRAERIREKRE